VAKEVYTIDFKERVKENEEKVDKIVEEIENKDVRFLRLQFVDIHGFVKNFAIPAERVEEALTEGVLFDGSSIEGFVGIEESDMYALPDPDTFAILPWRPKEGKVARMICDIYWPEGKPFEGCPRLNLKRVMNELAEKGYRMFCGPECEFYLVKEDPETGDIVPHDEGGYFDFFPLDRAEDVRREIIFAMEEFGLEVEMSHHEVGPGQHEIDFKFDDALRTADNVISFKQIVKAIAHRHGLTATFMPKPFYGENGNGMHTHQSLWDPDGEENLFYDPDAEDQYYLSDEALYYIGGIMEHAHALCAVCNPLVNSYKRLVPGYEAPVYIAWSPKNRSAFIRVPAARGKATRIEYRSPDPACNPYLAFAAMMVAGVDGIENKIDPGDPVNENLYEMSEKERKELGVDELPENLKEALEAFEEDEVVQSAFTDHIVEQWLELKYEEWAQYRERVTKWEVRKFIVY